MHTSSSRFSTCRRIVAAFMACIACCVGTPITQTLAVDYTWTSATTGGSWSVTGNWTPTGAPTSGDTAALTDATANRTVFYNSAASGTLTGLSFTQTTSGILNELRVQRNLTVTNALVLGASSGTAQLTLLGTSAANVTGTFSGGITVNSGGVLSLANFNPAGSASIFNSNLTGNVTVSGGRLDFSWVKEGTATSSANSTQVLTGNLTMSSGTIAFDNPLGTDPDRRLRITGDVSITGGRFTTNATSGLSNLRFDGASIVFAPTSYDSARFQNSLQLSGNQTYSGSTAIQNFFMRSTGIKTVSNSGTITTLNMFDEDSTGRSRTTLKLGSNLTVGSGGLGVGFSNVGTQLDYGIDADIYTLDLTGASGAWTPGTGGTGTQALWTLTGTAGRIIANGFNFSSARVDSSVGPGLILESRAGNGAANTLSTGTGSGTIDPTSVFRYAGAAAVATPSTLTSSRAIGILEVTSGALQVSSLPSLAGARVNGGTLIATSSNALPGFGSAGFVTFGGGTLQLPVDGTSWTMDQVDTIFTNATKTSGALAIDVASGVQTQTGSGYSGGIGLTKLGAGTLALTASNAFTGPTTVSAGTLALGNGGSAGSVDGAIALASGASLLVNRSNDLTLPGVISGPGSLTKQGAGTLTLSASNTYTGATTITAGTLALSGGDNRLATGGTVSFTGNGGLNISGSQSLAAVTLSPSVSAAVSGGGRLTLTGASVSISGSGSQVLDASGLTSFAYSNAAGTMTVSGSNVSVAASAALVLPASATITAATLGIGSVGNNIAVSSGTLTLGANATIASNAITLGSAQSQGTINVAAGTVNPVLRLRGSDGTSAVSNMTIGTSLTGYGLTTASRVDLTGGTGASTLDALVTNLVIGQSTRSTSFTSAINTSGGLLMQSGTLTAATITLGQTLNNPTFNASGQVISGSLSVSGGTVNVNTLYLADQNWTSGTVTGNFRLAGGGTLNAGTIASGTGAGAGSSVRTFAWDDGTIANLDASTDLSIGSGITFNLASTGQRRFSIGTGRSGTVASVLAGAGGTLEKSGAGTLVLTASNTYTGTTTVSEGTLRAGSGSTLGGSSAALAVNGGTLDLNGFSMTVGALSGSAGGTITTAATSGTTTLTTSASGNATFAGQLADNGAGILALTKLGSGTLTLSAANTYTGTTTISAGQLSLTGGSDRLATAAPITITGGVLDLGSAGQTTSGAISFRGGTVQSGTLTSTGNAFDGQNGTVSAILAGNVGLTKTTTGTLTLSGANTYTGASTVSAGTLVVNNASALGNTANSLAVNGGSLNLNGNSISVGALSGSSAGTITTNSASGTATLSTSLASGLSTFGGVIQDNGSGRVAFTKLGSGTLVLSAVNTYTGPTSVNAGTLQIGVAGGAAGRVTGDTVVNTGGTLLLRNVSGALGNVAVTGGRLEMTTVNQSIGALSMTSGTVSLGNSGLRLSVTGNASITGGSVMEPGSGGVINFFGATNVFAPQTLSAAYSFQLIASGNQTFSGSTALGALRIRGTGIKTVSNSGTISDISFVADTAGSPVTLKLGSNITTGSAGMNLAGFSQQGTALAFGVDADTYTLDLSAATGAWTPGTGGTGTTALWTLAGTAGRIIANGFDLSSARVDSSVGPGLILESRAGNSGTNNLSVGTGSGTIDSTSVFRYAGTAVAATPATLTSSRAIGDLEVTSGALRISSLAGLQNVRVTGGMLDLGNQSLSITSGSFGGGSVTSGTLTSSTFLATSGTVGASLAGVGGTLTKTGAGTFVLTGVNTFTGATDVNAGTLLVNGGLTGLGAVTVDSGATLGGSGSIAGAVTVNGFFSPGTSPGLLSVAALTLGGASTSVFEIDGTARATQYDGTDVTGALTYGGSLVIDFGSGITTAFTDNTIFNLFDFGSQSGAFTSITTANDGSFYAGLTFTPVGGGNTWTATKDSQTLEFTHSTGELVIVPEPGAIALAAIGIAAAAWARRRK